MPISGGTPKISGFIATGSFPIDYKYSASTINDMLFTPNKYEGMQVYVAFDETIPQSADTGNVYKLKSLALITGSTPYGEAFEHWEGIGTGGGGLASNTINDSTVSGNTVKDALENLDGRINTNETILDKLIPAPPSSITTKSLSLFNKYTALETDLEVTRTEVTDDTTPLIQLTPYVSGNGFLEIEGDLLSALVNGNNIGNVLLDNTDNSGTYGDLIVSEYDFYSGVTGQQGFWQALLTQIDVSSGLTGKTNTARFAMGPDESNIYTFYVDDPISVSLTGNSLTTTETPTNISGVPVLVNNDVVTASFTVVDAIRRFYNSTRIARAQSSYTNDLNAPLPLTTNYGDLFNASINLTIENNRFIDNLPITIIGYNSKGNTTSTNITNNIRVDSVSDESDRFTAGTGEFPSSGFGGTFDSSFDLSTSGNRELQLANGRFQYPSGDYTNLYPISGSDYTNLDGDLVDSDEYRWAMYVLPSQTDIQQVNVTLTQYGTWTLNAQNEIQDFKMYVKVGSGVWVDGNLAKGASILNDGDGGLIVSLATQTFRPVQVTNAGLTSGDVYIRFGLQKNSSMQFDQNITITAQA
ncbi:MAG: hypothetical protein ACOC33_01355 [bacterium]